MRKVNDHSLAILDPNEDPRVVLEADVSRFGNELAAEFKLIKSEHHKIIGAPQKGYSLVENVVLRDNPHELTFEFLNRPDIKNQFVTLHPTVLTIKLVAKLSVDDSPTRVMTIDIVPGTSPDKKKAGYCMVNIIRRKVGSSVIVSHQICPNLKVVEDHLPLEINSMAEWSNAMRFQ